MRTLQQIQRSENCNAHKAIKIQREDLVTTLRKTIYAWRAYADSCRRVYGEVTPFAGGLEDAAREIEEILSESNAQGDSLPPGKENHGH